MDSVLCDAESRWSLHLCGAVETSRAAQYFLSHLARDYGGYTCFCADVILHTWVLEVHSAQKCFVITNKDHSVLIINSFLCMYIYFFAVKK